MFRKAPRLLALLVSMVWLLAREAGAQPIGGIDSRPAARRSPGSCGSPGSCSTSTGSIGSSSLVDGVVVNQRGHEPAAARRPRDLPDLLPTARRPTRASSRRSTRVPTTTVRTPCRSASRESATQARLFSLPGITVNVDTPVNQAPFGYIDIPGADRPRRAPTGPSRSRAGRSTTSTSTTSTSSSTAGSWRARSAAASLRRRPTARPRPDVAAAFPDVPDCALLGVRRQHRHDRSSSTASTSSRCGRPTTRGLRASSARGASRSSTTGRTWRPSAHRLPARQGLALLHSPARAGSPRPARPTSASRRPSTSSTGWALDVGSRAGPRARCRTSSCCSTARSSRTPGPTARRSAADADQLLRHQPAGRRAAATRATSTRTTPASSFSFFLGRDNVSGQISILSPVSAGRSGARRLHDGRQAHGRDPRGRRGGDGHPDRRDVGRHPLRRWTRATSRPSATSTRRRTTSSSTASSRSSAGPTTSRASCRVEVDVDGQVVGNASYGLLRPDVPAHDFRVPTANVGLSFVLDTTRLSNSAHDLSIYVVDRAGNRTRDRAAQVRGGQQRPDPRLGNQTGGTPRNLRPAARRGVFFAAASRFRGAIESASRDA